MTYQIYSQQQLQHKSIAQLKQIYSEIACTVEVIDKRCKDSWVTAIVDYQASNIQKVTDKQAVVPELLRTEKITFYDYEIYAGDKLIAAITHDDNLTQPWVVMVNGAEEHRADTWAKCYRYICTHYKDGTLPVQEQLSEQNDTTGNEIMAQIFNECENLGLELLNDGIYNNDEKLGEVGCTDGCWWVTKSGERLLCNSVIDAVQSLSLRESANWNELLDRPFASLKFKIINSKFKIEEGGINFAF